MPIVSQVAEVLAGTLDPRDIAPHLTTDTTSRKASSSRARSIAPSGDRMIRVALLFGGRSSEHSISCATAGGVLGAIDRTRTR